MQLSELNKKLFRYTIYAVAAVIGIIVLFIVGKFIIQMIFGTKLSYTRIEQTMVKAAEAYYKENEHLLPIEETGEVTIKVSQLVAAEKMKDLQTYVKKEVQCIGTVITVKNGSYYKHIPRLDCGGDYTTKELLKEITSKGNVVTEKDGLYKIEEEYIYRGENVNNYVSFAGRVWRILKINKDNSIRMIQDDSFDSTPWDNRYNTSLGFQSGINDYNVSRIKDKLTVIYNNESNFTAKDKAVIVPQELCIGKRKNTDTKIDGSVECATKTPEKHSLGLIQVNEYMLASLDKTCTKISDKQCRNYNYLSTYSKSFWTITPSAVDTARVFEIDKNIYTRTGAEYSGIKMVVTISGSLNYKSGIGTLVNPYIIEL